MNSKQFFKKTLKKYKDGPKAVGWNSLQSQSSRFNVMTEIGNLKDKTILDFGCGLGDFFPIAYSKGIKSYTGYDISSDMIKKAKKKYLGVEFTDVIPNKEYDYTIASGVLNIKEPDWEDTCFAVMMYLWNYSKIGMGINFLSSFSNKQDKLSYYVNPLKILNEAFKITPKVILRHDYRSNDFTLFLYH